MERDRRRKKVSLFIEDEPSMTIEEIASELKMPRATVFWVVKTALEKMRKEAEKLR